MSRDDGGMGGGRPFVSSFLPFHWFLSEVQVVCFGQQDGVEMNVDGWKVESQSQEQVAFLLFLGVLSW